MKKHLTYIKEYLVNFLFYIQNDGNKLSIDREHVTGRGYWGIVMGFNFKSGKLNLSVFDYGMYFPREYGKNQLEGRRY